MALGDNFNDREMLEFAGRPVVMANAEPGVCCDGWARTLSNDEDGVAVALHRYIIDV
jgi:hydroxymethylpyrimidine pyrophosphatase-like HAD family hydrolase